MHLPRTRGFSLVEVTLAVAIIGLMIVATGFMLERLPVSGRETRDQDLALKIARGEVEELRAVGYDALPPDGPLSHALLSSLASSSAMLATSDYSEHTKQVTVTVSWRGAGAILRSVSLVTLMSKNSGLP